MALNKKYARKTPKPKKAAPKKKAGKGDGDWIRMFLITMAQTGNVRLSCRKAGIVRKTAYDWRDKDPEFAAKWDIAMDDACDTLEEVAWKRAKKTSDTLLIFLLKVHKGYQSTDNLQVSGPGGGPIEIEDMALEAKRAYLLGTIAALKANKEKEEMGLVPALLENRMNGTVNGHAN